MIRLLQSNPATLSLTWHDGTDVVDPGTVLLTIIEADGTVVVTEAGTAGSGAAERTFALTEIQTADLTVLTATWDSSSQGLTTVYYEVVGGTYVSIGELRNLDDLGNVERFTNSELSTAIDWWMALVERWCGVSFVPKYSKYDRYYTSGQDVFLKPRPREIQAALVDGVAVSTSGWRATPSGRIEGGVAPPTGQLVIHYTHGYDEPDEELRQEALTAIRSKLLTDQTGRPSRQTLVTNELGTVRLAQPGANRATGIPSVDRVLNDHIETPVMVA